MNTRYLTPLRTLLGPLAASLLASAAHAQVPLIVINPSFENDYGYLGGEESSSVLGWSNGGVGGEGFGFPFYQDGTSFTEGVDGFNTMVVNGTMYQDLGVNFIPGATYTLSVRIGTPPGVSNDGILAGFVADAVGSFTRLEPSSQTFFFGPDFPRGTLSTFTFTYTPTTAAPVIIGFSDFFPGDANLAHIDLVQVSYTLPSGLADWRLQKLGTSENTGDAADSADPDFDGRPNLIEYATGTEPLVADAGPAVVLGQAAGKLTLTFNRVADPALTYTVRGSNDLAAAWNEPPVFTSTGVDNTAGSVTAEDSVAVSTQPRRFLRLEVSY